jgi:hypothetical protein
MGTNKQSRISSKAKSNKKSWTTRLEIDSDEQPGEGMTAELQKRDPSRTLRPNNRRENKPN